MPSGCFTTELHNSAPTGRLPLTVAPEVVLYYKTPCDRSIQAGTTQAAWAERSGSNMRYSPFEAQQSSCFCCLRGTGKRGERNRVVTHMAGHSIWLLCCSLCELQVYLYRSHLRPSGHKKHISDSFKCSLSYCAATSLISRCTGNVCKVCAFDSSGYDCNAIAFKPLCTKL